jgi:hypothetical protein
MSTDLCLSSIGVRDPECGRRPFEVISAAEKTSAITRVRFLEHEVFDGDGHVRRRLNPAKVEEMVARINELRHTLGWLEIDLEGRWRWPN